MLKLALISVFSGVLALAAPVAVIDSGTDFEHFFLKDSILASDDIMGNLIDDNGSGYIDDGYGWNFAEDSNVQVDRSIIPSSFPDYVRGLSILMKLSAQVYVAEEDYEWIKELWNGPDGPLFRQEINKTANFSHGTHVSGIIARESDFSAELMSLQIMPTVEFSDIVIQEELDEKSKTQSRTKITDDQIIDMFKSWAQENKDSWLNEIALLSFREVRVANCSFGFGYSHSIEIIKNICARLSIECDNKRLDILARAFLTHYKRHDSERLISTDPSIFFVIAAGNDGLDNDIYPDEPANYITDNRIVVASTDHKGLNLAKFSNYGIQTVDIAAPGEIIESSYPDDLMGIMSGTSQAAPFVAGVAASVVDINPELTPLEIKTILNQTVDKKSWLKEKVLSGGIVNKNRAKRAAELSKNLPLSQAITLANQEVEDEVYLSFRYRFDSIPMDQFMKSFVNDLIKNSRVTR